MNQGASILSFSAAPSNMKLVRPVITVCRLCRAPAWAIVAALVCGSDLDATPPSLPPTNFHPFGPPTQLIPDGSVVPLRPIRPVAPMSPLFMMPQEPFGRLGQNWGALGGAVSIDQKQTPAHRQPIELVPQIPRGDKKTAPSAATGGGYGAPASTTPHRGAAYRRPLGW
ncbi:MAG: hypothetical protein C0483_16630 [Pirellula sp.]|nr:hypothetical protein [Pirellula sp.]